MLRLVSAEGRDGSKHSKRLRRAEGLEPRQGVEKPRGRDESVDNKNSRSGDKVRP